MKRGQVSSETVRRHLFYCWCSLFVVYVCLFLLSSVKANVGFPLAADAMWKVAYLILPVLGAFGGYWFSGEQQDRDTVEIVDEQKRHLMMVLTGVLHGVVLLLIVVGILLADFKDQEEPASYPQRVDLILKFMLLIWSISLLPVGWLLKGQKIAAPNLPVEQKRV